MYAAKLKTRDKGGAIAAVIGIHAALAFALLNLSGTISLTDAQRDLQVFDVREIEPPPPPEPPVVEERRPEPDRAEEPEGAAAPENIRSQATPVVAPPPRIKLPVTPPIAVTQTPAEGAAPTQGAGDQRGPGTGAGGTGTGTGAGGSGAGTGGGGSGIPVTRPALVRDVRGSDYPDEVWRRWPRGAAVDVAVRVQPDGTATDCKINRSSGVPAIDQWTCRLVEERARFRPARDETGQPVVAWYGYRQAPTGEMIRRRR